MNQRIMVIDDDASQCRCMAIGLRVEGFEVVEAISGDQALGNLELGVVDVAVVDLMMPGMNGLELCRVMKQRHPAAYHLSKRQLELAGIGHAKFLGKPFTVERLAAAVRERLDCDDAPAPLAANGD